MSIDDEIRDVKYKDAHFSKKYCFIFTAHQKEMRAIMRLVKEQGFLGTRFPLKAFQVTIGELLGDGRKNASFALKHF